MTNRSEEYEGRIAVLVPACNESAGLRPTIDDIKSQLRPGDQVVVVADNCTDDTAAIARAAGAVVVERNDAEKIGKGYALDCGLRHLAHDPPEVVIVVDADCRLLEGTIRRLAADAAATQRPAQALYLMNAPENPSVSYHVALFAWRVKNRVRPLGLAALGLPCQVMGTGIAFPWKAIYAIDLATGFLVEDLKLGIDLALAGSPPLFCPAATVTSEFPFSAAGMAIQRKRWEHGHLAMIAAATPSLIRSAIARRSPNLLAIAVDLAIPPLSLLAMMVFVTAALTAVAAPFGIARIASVVSAINLLLLVVAVFLAWLNFGRDVLPLIRLFSIPAYVLRKVPLYLRLLLEGKTTHWVRTDRTPPNQKALNRTAVAGTAEAQGPQPTRPKGPVGTPTC